MELQIGQLIAAPFLPASAEVKKFESRPGYYRLEVLLRDGSNQYLSQNISASQLAQIQMVERNPVALTNNAEDFFFLIEAHRLRLAYQFDPQLAVSISQVDLLPHQIEAVYHYVLESPCIRFLIADDPGAGKTTASTCTRPFITRMALTSIFVTLRSRLALNRGRFASLRMSGRRPAILKINFGSTS
jgi:hypothetical protein